MTFLRSLFEILLLCVGLGLAAGATSQAAQATVQARTRMVTELAEAEGITNRLVLDALQTVPRHEFLARRWRPYAYYDMALPIGHAQTLTQPSVVAYMTQQLDPRSGDRVLEVGAGSGYQAAVLSRLVKSVYTVEIVPALGRQARATLRRLATTNVHLRIGDGYQGWAEHAPFDKIIVTCSPEQVPAPLVEQLAEGGRLIIPLGEAYQQTLCLFTKTDGRLERAGCAPTAFVPMTGEADALRRRKTDALEPELVNGGFELIDPATQRLAGWYRQRQLTVQSGGAAPEGRQFVTFRNRESGRPAHASQAFAVDGRRVRTLRIAGRVRGDGVRVGAAKHEIAAVVITFYDQDRGVIDLRVLGDWRGSFDWTAFGQDVAVPRAAREGIVQIGLEGATGTLSLDGLTMRGTP